MVNMIDLDDPCNGCDHEEGDDVCSECRRMAIYEMVHGGDITYLPDRYEQQESVVEIFADILQKNADLFRDEKGLLLVEGEADGFTTLFMRLLNQIVDQCKEEELIDTNVEVVYQ